MTDEAELGCIAPLCEAWNRHRACERVTGDRTVPTAVDDVLVPSERINTVCQPSFASQRRLFIGLLSASFSKSRWFDLFRYVCRIVSDFGVIHGAH